MNKYVFVQEEFRSSDGFDIWVGFFEAEEDTVRELALEWGEEIYDCEFKGCEKPHVDIYKVREDLPDEIYDSLLGTTFKEPLFLDPEKNTKKFFWGDKIYRDDLAGEYLGTVYPGNIEKIITDAVAVDNEKQEALLSIPGLAAALEKVPVKRVLPNGREVEQIVWVGKDLKKVSRAIRNISGDLPKQVKIDGPAPAWLTTAIVRELHPRKASLNSPDGFVPVGMRRPSGNGTGENLVWKVGEADGWHVVHVELKDPSQPLDPKNLPEAAPPELPLAAKIVLSGRAPNWLMASAAMAYHDRAMAVALYQPGNGATVAITYRNDLGVKLGSVVPEETVKKALEGDRLEQTLGAFENGAPKPNTPGSGSRLKV